MPVFEPVRVEGLRELNRALRAVDADLPRGMRLAANEAAEVVVQEARRGVPTLTGRARGSIRATSTRTAARVSGGGRRAPYFPWLDYGGRVGPAKSVQRRFIAEGRFIYPAFTRQRARFTAVLAAGLSDLITRAGLDES